MTNIYASPGKGNKKTELFQCAVTALQKDGWTVERIPRSGKASVRKISKGGKSLTASIRTTQDRFLSFSRTNDDKAWLTLKDADCVVVASVDDPTKPERALVHMFPAAEVRDRFDQSYAARMAAGHSIPIGRGMWLSLYDQESTNPVSLVGAGLGLKYPPIATMPISASSQGDDEGEDEEDVAASVATPSDARSAPAAMPVLEDAPFTIAEAKRRLAKSLGVAESDIKITICS